MCVQCKYDADCDVDADCAALIANSPKRTLHVRVRVKWKQCKVVSLHVEFRMRNSSIELSLSLPPSLSICVCVCLVLWLSLAGSVKPVWQPLLWQLLLQFQEPGQGYCCSVAVAVTDHSQRQSHRRRQQRCQRRCGDIAVALFALH